MSDENRYCFIPPLSLLHSGLSSDQNSAFSHRHFYLISVPLYSVYLDITIMREEQNFLWSSTLLGSQIWDVQALNIFQSSLKIQNMLDCELDFIQSYFLEDD